MSGNGDGHPVSPHSTSQLSWLLQLPPEEEVRFYRDVSIQRIFSMFDAIVCLQALVFNGRILSKFGIPQKLGEPMPLMMHEQAFTTLFWIISVFQLLFMSFRPGQYILHRQRIALINRLLRLLAITLTAILLTPAQAQRHVEALLSLLGNNALVSGSSSTILQLQHSAAMQDCTYGPQCAPSLPGSLHTAATVGTAAGPYVPSMWALLKAFLVLPSLYLTHANQFVTFRLAAIIQVVTAVVAISMDMQRLCVAMAYVPALPAAMVPACEALSGVMHAGAQLLDVQFPASPGALSAASNAVCADPLVALLLIRVWVHLVLLVLLPCAMIYSLEWSLKSSFLSGQSAAAASRRRQPVGPASLPSQEVQSATSSLQQPQQQQGQERISLQEALRYVRPVPVAELLSPVWGGNWWHVMACAGLMLCSVQVCWYACELYIVALLRGGRQFTCDSEGWLRLT